MSDDAAALTAEANLLVSISIWAAACEHGGLEHGEGWTLAWSREPLRSFNNLIVTSDDADLISGLATARKHAPEGKFRLRLREGLACIDDASAPSFGLRHAGGIPSLVLGDLTRPETIPGTVREADSPASLSDHVSIVARAFEWDPAVLARVFTPALLQDSRWRGYVAYVDGQPAASSQFVIGPDGAAGIYYVGTVPEFRHKGLGRAITARGVADARAAGCQQVSLQASPMGLPIYTGMGFRHVAYYRQFLPA